MTPVNNYFKVLAGDRASMMGKKSQRALQAKKLRLEAQVAGADGVIDEMPPEVRSEIARVCAKLGIDDIWKGKPRTAGAQNGRLSPEEHAILGAFYQTILSWAQDKHQLEEIELLLSPRKGRPTQDDPRILAAMKEWEDGGRKKSLRYLSTKHCGKNDPVTRQRFLERLKKATRKERLTAPAFSRRIGK